MLFGTLLANKFSQVNAFCDGFSEDWEVSFKRVAIHRGKGFKKIEKPEKILGRYPWSNAKKIPTYILLLDQIQIISSNLYFAYDCFRELGNSGMRLHRLIPDLDLRKHLFINGLLCSKTQHMTFTINSRVAKLIYNVCVRKENKRWTGGCAKIIFKIF